MIVADTNLIVYLLINGEHTPAAEQIYRKDPAWLAPAIWRHEFCSALSIYVRKQLMTVEEAVELDRRAREVVLGAGSPGIREVLELARSSGCSSYDCEFIALAKFQAVPLVTSDAKLMKAFPHIAVAMDAYLARA